VDDLAAHLARRGLTAADRNGLVFCSPKGEPLRYQNWLRRTWRPAWEPAGLPALRSHDLVVPAHTNVQVAATVAWQATVVVAIGTVVGAPLGVALGRSLWDLFAREINAVPEPSAPFVSVLLIAVGALVVANLVAAVPGRIAARTPTAHAFRTE